jgi:hypothetical protein
MQSNGLIIGGSYNDLRSQIGSRRRWPECQNVPPQRSLSAAAAVVAPPLLAPYPTSTASNENYHTYQHLPLADRATYRTKLSIFLARGARIHTSTRCSLSVPRRRRGSPRLRFAAREAELCTPASRYKALRRSGRTRERLRRKFKALATGEGAYEHSEAMDRPRPPIERSKVLGHPSSPLRLRAACVPHALHPTDEFDAPSVRKSTKPENTRVQPPQGVPTFRPREYHASSPRCVCVR